KGNKDHAKAPSRQGMGSNLCGLATLREPFQQVRQRTSQTAADHLPQKAREDTKEDVGRGSQASVGSVNGGVQRGRANDLRLQKRQLAVSVATHGSPLRSLASVE
ncbi:hypothetical protein NZK35_33030, partial [Stieleria sp. ICT_E10.1]|nr:hypothetical protein [Stieleria sedimenti]